VRLRAPEIVSETLGNKTGARVGLVVSKGYERTAYFDGKGKNPFLDSIVVKEMVVGIGEEAKRSRRAGVETDEEKVKNELRNFLNLGVEL
jgi:hypothetical protein